MRNIFHFTIATFAFLTITSCQKVIDVKLNSSAQQYVIEGEITDAAGPYTVTISRTRDFTENNDFEKIGGASVIIKDVTANTTDTLRQASAGTYQTSITNGVPGHTYQLSVVVNGKSFTASSAMPTRAVTIDSLYAAKSTFGSDDIFMVPVYTDPVGMGNYYRIRQWINGVQVKGSRVRSDEATDGTTYRSQLFYDTDVDAANPIIKLNDSIRAELQCINKSAYDYFRTLHDATGDNSATPANPLTNITGGALGVFNACISRTKRSKAVF
jgi:hypothetical protein